MESFSAEASKVKDHTVLVFDNLTVAFRVWKEKIELYMMANSLYTGILDDGEVENKKSLPSKSLQCYTIICTNLSDSFMDVVRRVKSRDP
jgi:hypothetical protein